jgi:hypothetical protein
LTETTLLEGTETAAADQTSESPVVESGPDSPQTDTSKELPGWVAGLKSEQKANEYFHKFSKVSEFAEEHLKLKEQMDKSVIMPDDEASQEALDEFYKKLGRPEKADKYDLPAKVEGFEVPKDFADSIRNTAFEMGLSQKQAKGLYEAQVKQYQTIANEITQAYKVAMEDGEKQLKGEWRADYNANLEVARRGYQSFADQGIKELLNSTGIGNHPEILKLFHRIGKQLSPDSSIPGDPPSPKKSPYVVNYKPMK